jgi:hypothetical protein
MPLSADNAGRKTYGSSNNERRFHDCPKSKMGPVFFDGQVSIADFEHVGVVVAPEIYTTQLMGVEICNSGNTGPCF